MCATFAKDEFVVIYGVSWDAYEKILSALGENHLRHTYDRGALEMRSVIHGVSWDQYEAFLAALQDHSVRHSYDRGTLEMMTPSRDHDWTKSLIGRFIETMAYELDLRIQSVGSTTLQKMAIERGVQPDESYYVANEPVVRARLKLDPAVDPPPDLIIEVDVTNSCLDRFAIFAALGISELWRHDDKQLVFYGLSASGKYEVLDRSRAFPWLVANDVQQFVSQIESSDETSLARAFAKHARAQFEAYSRAQQT
ncbi:MAG TPA: Uma2 family endonuclease [Pirellulales bacterium]|nr:Uma2 family endonuclease [Pirellulales bacterium]